ncbi:MAG: ferritin family protein, partial [Clostridia bacterium]
KMIKEVATNEFHHARMLFSFIDSADTKHTIDNITVSAGYPFKQKIGTLEENLRLAVEDEQNEAHKIYPEFAQVAKKEGFNDIANLFLNLVQVETCHSKLFQILYDQMKNGTMYKLPNLVKWKCKDCGYEETLKEAWQKCPICMAPQGHVMLHINDGAK